MTNNLQVWINEQLIDLRPGTVIAKTIQAFDLFAFGTARANYTNQITAPKTNNNQKALQFVDNLKSASTYAYQLLPARVIQNGIELIGNGFAQIVSSDTSYNITFFDGNYAFFTQLADKKLWDIDLSSLNGQWGGAEKDAARTAVSGLIPAVINFGNWLASGANLDGTAYGHANPPSIFYSTLLDKIFSTFGFTYSGNVFSLDKFKKMIMPLNLIYSPKFCTAKEFNASAPGTQVMVNPLVATKVTFNNVGTNGTDNYYDGVDTWTPNLAAAAANYFLVCNFGALVNITVAGGTVDIKMRIDNSIGPDIVIATGVGSGTYSAESSGGIDATYPLNTGWRHGDHCYVTIIQKTGAPTVTINSGVFWNKVPVVTPGINWNNSYIVPQHLLPDMLITDLMKDFAVRFGLLFKESKGSIQVRNIDELINDTGTAVDWTAKRDTSVPEKLSYQFPNFSQVNKLKWDNSADSTLSKDYQMGSFAVPNIHLSPEQTITSPFSASSTLATLGINMGQAVIYDSVTPKFTGVVGSRLMLVRDPYVGEPTVKFNAAFQAAYKVGYFLDGKQANQMSFAQDIASYLSQFPLRMQSAKMILRSYNLNDVDINNFDQLKLIYDDGAFFIVNKISSYVPGKSTSVELFKV